MEPPVPTRILGLDVGDRGIGVAVSDPLGFAALGLLTLRRTTLREDLKSIAALIRKYGITEIVIGHPLYRSGRLSPQALKAESFARSLAEHLAKQKIPGSEIQPIHLWDERISINRSQRHVSDLDPRGQSGRVARRNVVDPIAAVLILQAFIDSRDVQPRLSPTPPTHGV